MEVELTLKGYTPFSVEQYSQKLRAFSVETGLSFKGPFSLPKVVIRKHGKKNKTIYCRSFRFDEDEIGKVRSDFVDMIDKAPNEIQFTLEKIDV